jgi:hypothetical protein
MNLQLNTNDINQLKQQFTQLQAMYLNLHSAFLNLKQENERLKEEYNFNSGTNKYNVQQPNMSQGAFFQQNSNNFVALPPVQVEQYCVKCCKAVAQYNKLHVCSDCIRKCPNHYFPYGTTCVFCGCDRN